jgi:amino acid transporter
MPLWITLFISDGKAHKDALEEIIIVTIVSLIPLFLLAVVDQLRGHSDLDFILFWEAISSGQLYLYSFAMLGMIFWLCLKDHEQLERFPPRKYLGILAFVFSVIIVAVYTVDPSLSKHLSTPLVKASLFVYVAYTLLYYILRVYDNLRPPSVEIILRSEADDLQARYEGSRE